MDHWTRALVAITPMAGVAVAVACSSSTSSTSPSTGGAGADLGAPSDASTDVIIGDEPWDDGAVWPQDVAVPDGGYCTPITDPGVCADRGGGALYSCPDIGSQGAPPGVRCVAAGIPHAMCCIPADD